MALVVRADFHWLLDRRVKVKSLSPASARLSARALHFSRHLRTNALRRVDAQPRDPLAHRPVPSVFHLPDTA